MLALREHENDLLSALPCAVGTVKRNVNVSMRAAASVLGSFLDRLESFFLSSSNGVMALLQTSEASNKNLKITHVIKLMSLLETLRPL